MDTEEAEIRTEQIDNFRVIGPFRAVVQVMNLLIRDGHTISIRYKQNNVWTNWEMVQNHPIHKAA